MERGAVDEPGHVTQSLRRHFQDRLAQRAMLGREKLQILPPVLLVRFFRQKPVAALACERSALFAGEFAAHRVFQVRAVHCQLLDVVSLELRTPHRLLGADSTQRASQVRTMPRPLFVGLIEQSDEKFGRHRCHPEPRRRRGILFVLARGIPRFARNDRVIATPILQWPLPPRIGRGERREHRSTFFLLRSSRRSVGRSPVRA